MHTRQSRPLLLPLLGALACGPSGPPGLTAEHAEAVADSVNDALAAYVQRVNSWDWDGAAAFYADDPRFRWIEDGRTAYTSPDDIRTAYQALQGSFESAELTLRDTRVVPLAPGLANVSTSFAQALTDTAGGRFEFEGALTITLVHTPDGWRFLSGHTSSRRASRGR